MIVTARNIRNPRSPYRRAQLLDLGHGVFTVRVLSREPGGVPAETLQGDLEETQRRYQLTLATFEGLGKAEVLS